MMLNNKVCYINIHDTNKMKEMKEMKEKVKETSEKEMKPIKYPLANKWTVWSHLPHNNDWSLNSYEKIMTLGSLDEAISLMEIMPTNIIDSCMLFVMKNDIKPSWEDKQNRDGGCFSYKILNKNVHTIWKNIFYSLIGESMSNYKPFVNDITGISISPKKNFCIIKVWMSNCNHQDPNIINENIGLNNDGCLFKQHIPEW